MEYIYCSFNTIDSLSLAFMPFVTGGGLFVRADRQYLPGAEVSLVCQLMQVPERYTISGKVVWIGSCPLQKNLPEEIGVQFIGDESEYLCNKIEGYLSSSDVNDTF